MLEITLSLGWYSLEHWEIFKKFLLSFPVFKFYSDFFVRTEPDIHYYEIVLIRSLVGSGPRTWNSRARIIFLRDLCMSC